MKTNVNVGTLSRPSFGFLVLSLALTGLLALVPAAGAQRYERGDVTSQRGYDQMRRFAYELDRLVAQANRQAQADQAGYRGFRRDGNFLKSIDNFARRVRQFRTRMESYRTQPWRVDDEVERLTRDARKVQKRIERARFVDARTRRDWNQVIYLLDRVGSEYRYVRDDRRYDDRYGNGRYDDRYGDDYGYGSSDLRQLAYELDQRAARANELALRTGSGWGEIRDFRDQARYFRDRIESGNLSRATVRSELNRLLADAQDAHRQLEQMRVSRELSAEWDAVVQILNRMRQIAVA